MELNEFSNIEDVWNFKRSRELKRRKVNRVYIIVTSHQNFSSNPQNHRQKLQMNPEFGLGGAFQLVHKQNFIFAHGSGKTGEVKDILRKTGAPGIRGKFLAKLIPCVKSKSKKQKEEEVVSQSDRWTDNTGPFQPKSAKTVPSMDSTDCQSENYLVKSGVCVLICNGEFANAPKREGMWWDVANGEEYVGKLDQYDCLVVIISSHGSEDQTASDKDQACRVRMTDSKDGLQFTDPGVEVGLRHKDLDQRQKDSFNNKPISSADALGKMPETFVINNKRYDEHTAPIPQPEDMVEAVITPCYTDCLLMFASPSGKFAWSDYYSGNQYRRQGGWLLMSLYSILMPKIMKRQSFEILEVLTEVCQEMAQNYETAGNKDLRFNELVSVPCFSHMLLGDLLSTDQLGSKQKVIFEAHLACCFLKSFSCKTGSPTIVDHFNQDIYIYIYIMYINKIIYDYSIINFYLYFSPYYLLFYASYRYT
ncbi:hypothetical protein KUTeg_013219, partial [Tegillarca granosa]